MEDHGFGFAALAVIFEAAGAVSDVVKWVRAGEWRGRRR